MDSLYETWFTDPHSDFRFSISTKKRGRDGGHEQSNRDDRRNVYQSDRELSSSSPYSSRPDRDHSNYSNSSRSNRDLSNSSYRTYLCDFPQQRDKYPKRGG